MKTEYPFVRYFSSDEELIGPVRQDLPQEEASEEYRTELPGCPRQSHDSRNLQWYSRLERVTALGGSAEMAAGVKLP